MGFSATRVVQDAQSVYEESQRRPEDVASKTNEEAMDKAKEEFQGHVDEALDPLDELGLFPFDLLGKAMKKMIPTCMTQLNQKFERCISSWGMSGFLHLIMVEMLPVYFFVYSVYTLLFTIIVEIGKENAKNYSWSSDHEQGPYEQVNTCLNKWASDMIWFEGAFDWKVCYRKSKTGFLEYQHEPIDATTGTSGGIFFGCLLLCITLCLVMLGSFLRHTKCAFWRMPFQSGKYLQFSYTVRQGFLYRYVSGAIALGACFSIFYVLFAGRSMMGFLIQTQLTSMVMVALSARAFIVPFKPKFNFKHADFAGIRFRRASFWQMNGSFALLYGNAILQCSRSKQFRRHLMDRLEQPNDWEHVLHICLQEDTTTSNGVWQKSDIGSV